MTFTKTLQTSVLISTISFAVIPAQAATKTIDFNSLATVTTNPEVVVSSPYIEDGFKLITGSGSPYTGYAGGTIYALTDKHSRWTGSPSVYSGVITNYGSNFVLERADGGIFDLLSIDAAAFQNHVNARAFSVYGYKPSSPYVYNTFTLDDSFGTLETLNFDNTFTGLNKIVFSSVYAQVDNINLSVSSTSTVPEPENYALIMAGLCLVGFRTHRRISKNVF